MFYVYSKVTRGECIQISVIAIILCTRVQKSRMAFNAINRGSAKLSDQTDVTAD